MPSAFDLSRRNALKYLGLLAATAGGREFLASWLPQSEARGDDSGKLVTIHGMDHREPESEPAAPYTPQFFKPAEFATVDILTEMILPADDQPGARAARVADYIDFVVFSAAEFEPELQAGWSKGLVGLDTLSQKHFQKPFREASETDQLKLLMEMSAPEHDSSLHHEGFPFYQLLKSMTVEAFYTSKIGLIDVLDYQGMNYNADFPGCTHPEHQQ